MIGEKVLATRFRDWLVIWGTGFIFVPSLGRLSFSSDVLVGEEASVTFAVLTVISDPSLDVRRAVFLLSLEIAIVCEGCLSLLLLR